MTAPSRKLRHTAEASLTVFADERGGAKNPYQFLMFCDILKGFVKFCNFFVIFGGQTDGQTDQQTDRQT